MKKLKKLTDNTTIPYLQKYPTMVKPSPIPLNKRTKKGLNDSNNRSKPEAD